MSTTSSGVQTGGLAVPGSEPDASYTLQLTDEVIVTLATMTGVRDEDLSQVVPTTLLPCDQEHTQTARHPCARSGFTPLSSL